MDVKEFTGEFRFLSNFYPSPIVYGEVDFPTVENAYQASKDWRTHVQKRMALLTPALAKKAGQGKVDLRTAEEKEYKVRPIFVGLANDWDQRKNQIMLDLIRLKFKDPVLRAKLLATDGKLEEGNDWGDQYWGISRGKGTNHLGLILMQVRDEIRLNPEQ